LAIDLVLPPNDSIERITALSSDTISSIVRQAHQFLQNGHQCASGFYGASTDDESELVLIDTVLSDLPQLPEILWIRGGESSPFTIYLDLRPPADATIVRVNEWGILLPDDHQTGESEISGGRSIPRDRVVHLTVDFDGTVGEFLVDGDGLAGAFLEFLRREFGCELGDVSFSVGGVPIDGGARLSDCCPRLTCTRRLLSAPVARAGVASARLRARLDPPSDINPIPEVRPPAEAMRPERIPGTRPPVSGAAMPDADDFLSRLLQLEEKFLRQNRLSYHQEREIWSLRLEICALQKENASLRAEVDHLRSSFSQHFPDPP
jgi:hypothetical protein